MLSGLGNAKWSGGHLNNLLPTPQPYPAPPTALPAQPTTHPTPLSRPRSHSPRPLGSHPAHLAGSGGAGDGAEHVADGDLGVLLDVAHVGVDDVQAVLGDELADEGDAAVVGGDLGAEVGEDIADVAGGRAAGEVAGRVEQRHDAVLLELTAAHELERLDARALLVQFLGQRRHRPGRDPANVGVVPAARDEKDHRGAVEH